MVTQEEIVLIKGKRSKRPRPPSPLALTMPDELLTRGHGDDDEEEKDMAYCLMLLAKGQTKNCYQCKTCHKSFSSFQALGGHRASHTKTPPPIMIKPITTIIGNNNNNKQDFFLPSSRGESTILSLQTPAASRIGRVHECSICGTGFSSGQALGGHMRRHRPLPAASGGGKSGDQEAKRLRTVLSLDLNLPAPEDNNNHDHDQREEENKFSYGVPQPQQQQQLIVFSASSLVDCLY